MYKRILFLPIFILLFTGCKNNDLDIDISNIDVKPLKVLRLEDDVFSLNALNFEVKNKEISSKYGSFYEHYVARFLNSGANKDSLYKPAILNFINDKDMHETYLYVKKIYPNKNIEEINVELTKCVKRFKYHFPKRKLPTKLITCTTGYNYAVAYTDSALVLGLDMYLNDTTKFYKMLNTPLYQLKTMNEHYILPNLAKGWLLTEFDNEQPVNTLIYHTIFYGKLFYTINALLPNTEDSLIIGYSNKQLNYCLKNEKNLWGYFAEKNRLYENNLKTVQELTSDGPFTGSISKECPPRIAMWVGLQIVRSYMKNNKGATLEQLMNEKDAQLILSKSKYRP
ncbi:MAG: hypothetical protein Q7W45_05285 [Bacteroidota bacterium]|nr:hypothetical protein [Bacteroidota bacterium]MDP3144861.1 hypothetical protein [Bacteroidota bacterium]